MPTADEGAACFDGTCCCSEGVETLGAIGTAFEGFGGIGSEDTVDPPLSPQVCFMFVETVPTFQVRYK